jgi:hypothetical protein
MEETPSKDWKEKVQGDEAEKFERLAMVLAEAQKRKPGDKRRVLHAKGSCGLRGVFTIADYVPIYARVGIFARPGTYRAYVRLSNGSPTPQHDSKGDVRGLAVKLLGVSGQKLIPGMENATTQDFLFVRSRTIPFRDPEEFVWTAVAAQSPLTFLPKTFFRFGLRAIPFLRALRKSLSVPYESAATCSFHAILPVRFGDHAAKFSLFPESQAEEPTGIQGENTIREDAHKRLLNGTISYQVRAQFFVNEDKTPIERPDKEWKESDAPFVTLARLTLPTQDIESADGKRISEYVERLSFDPWHAPVEFRPLGAMMRARNVAYRVSTVARAALPEPSGTDWA